MTADQTPAVPRRRWPTSATDRPNAGPAWLAGWNLLAEDAERPRAEIIAAMRAANPISYRTARDILTQAVSSGLLEVVSRDRYGRPTLRRKQ